MLPQDKYTADGWVSCVFTASIKESFLMQSIKMPNFMVKQSTESNVFITFLPLFCFRKSRSHKNVFTK